MKPSKAERKRQQKIFSKKQRFKENLNYYIFIGFAIAFVLFYWLKPDTIGHSITYLLLIQVLPVAMGITLSFIFRKKLFNTNNFTALKNIKQKAAAIVILLIAVTIGSYITLGLVTNVSWECANYYVAENNKTETIILPVAEFHKGSGRKATHSIKFHFQGKKERIRVSIGYIRQCLEQSATKKHIKLRVRKGLWNHYLVEDWDIIR